MTTPSFLDSIDSQLDWQREVYKDLHRNPEVSLDEHKTAERIESELPVLGLDVKRIGETGRVAVIENAEGPPSWLEPISMLSRSPRTPVSTSRPRSTESCTPVDTICMLPPSSARSDCSMSIVMPGQARTSPSSSLRVLRPVPADGQQ
ncbi:hypothetical protein BLIN101_00869 [Brevibacterium linens]|uniref:Uncharacterized protein n=1 Tax=Brevibacterium linens TaxID=1703 RepID=A0A2H1I5N1_BRELN|nr:hypothetical protein BLIN101_00869 [Brevibacterium linens]